MRAWHFVERRPDDRLRDSTLDAFFTNDTINRPGEALIREGIQNSLDAAEGEDGIHIRVFVSGDEGAAESSKLKSFFDGAWEHFLADANGLSDVHSKDQKFCFLIFEDFGTTGLQGDPAQPYPAQGKNPFYYFFRAEGRSDKGEQDRGRWGIGKDVFLQASQLRAIFGITVRSDDQKRFLMGQCVLRSHRVGSKWYLPDGWYGQKENGKIVMPVEEPTTIEKFCHVFGLKRDNRPGLSIVVPWCDTQITRESLVEAVARGYYYPILSGCLSVTVEDPCQKTIIDNTSIRRIIQQSSNSLAKEVDPLIELAAWARDNRGSELLHLDPPPTKNAPKWKPNIIPEKERITLANSLNEGEPVGIRVPLFVRRRNSASQRAYFDVFIMRAEQNDVRRRPQFIRNGIIIPEVRSSRVSGVHSLVIVEDKALATLLGDAENPSHTRWENTSNLKRNYIYGNSYITFVANSVNELIRILSDADRVEDTALLMDLFSLPPISGRVSQEVPVEKPTSKPGIQTPPDPQIPSSEPVKLRVQKVPEGFCVLPGTVPTPMKFIDIKVAYDTRRGNSLKKYHAFDFQLDNLRIHSRGLDILRRIENQVIVRVCDPNFRLEVKGFDQKRDLYVRARETLNGD